MLVVEGLSESVPLRVARRAPMDADSLFARWARMPAGRAADHGRNGARQPASAPGGHPAPLEDAAAEERADHAEAEECADDYVDQLIEDEIELAEAGRFNLEEALAEMFDSEFVGVEAAEESQNEEEQEDEEEEEQAPAVSAASMGGDVQAAADVGEAFGGEPSGVAEPDVVVVAEASQEVEAALVAAETAASPFGAGAEVSPDGTVFLSALGYVKSSRPEFGLAMSLGLIGMNGNGRVMWANCHLHPHCNIHCGVVREPMSRMRLAQWLALGVPCGDRSIEERRKLGAEHRMRWRRHGDFAEPASSSTGG